MLGVRLGTKKTALFVGKQRYDSERTMIHRLPRPEKKAAWDTRQKYIDNEANAVVIETKGVKRNQRDPEEVTKNLHV